jgi:hypothetical protein
MQTVFRLFFLLCDIVGNIYILSTHQTLPLGSLLLDYVQFTVVFNAAAIVVIYIVDFVMYKTEKFRLELNVGKGLVDR